MIDHEIYEPDYNPAVAGINYHVIGTARELVDDPGHSHPEYLRAILELTGELTGHGTEDLRRRRIAPLLGIDHDAVYPSSSPATPASTALSGTTGPWHRRSPFYYEDSGHVGGDAQAGPSYSLEWQRRLASGEYETLTLWHFAARDDSATVNPRPGYRVSTMIGLLRHTDPDDPGGTEVQSDYRYESDVEVFATDDGEHGRLLADAKARLFAVENYDTDPADLAWPLP